MCVYECMCMCVCVCDPIVHELCDGCLCACERLTASILPLHHRHELSYSVQAMSTSFASGHVQDNAQQLGIPVNMVSSKLFPLILDYPSRGIGFRDIRPFFGRAITSDHRQELYTQFKIELHKHKWFDDAFLKARRIVCLHLASRGFLMTEMLQKVFGPLEYIIIPVTKPNDKLTGVDEWVTTAPSMAGTLASSITTEYSDDALHIGLEALQPGDLVIGFDDILVTAGSVQSLKTFAQARQATFCGVITLLEIEGCGGRDRLAADGIGFASMFRLPKVSPHAAVETQSIGAVPIVLDPRIAEREIEMARSLTLSPASSKAFPHTANLHHDCVLFSETCQWETAMRVRSYLPQAIRIGGWTKKSFHDTFPDFTIEHQDQLQSDGKHLVWLGSLWSPNEVFPQNSMLTALNGQPAASITAIYPFVPTATHERIKHLGRELNLSTQQSEFRSQDIATADTLFRQIGGSVKKTRLMNLMHFDIHDVHENLYTPECVLNKDMSMIPMLLRTLSTMYDEEERKSVAVAFPDAGAYQRFVGYFDGWKQVVCNKERLADERNIDVAKEIGMNDGVPIKVLIVVDDLVQSGSTLIKAAKLLVRRYQSSVQQVFAYATHMVLPRRGERLFFKRPGFLQRNVPVAGAPSGAYGEFRGFDLFFTTNSNPMVTKRIRGRAPFVVFDIAPVIFHHLAQQNQWNNPNKHPDLSQILAHNFYGTKHAVVASKNKDKILAVRLAMLLRFPFAKEVIVHGEDTASRIPEQPLGAVETRLGAQNRLIDALEIAVTKHKGIGYSPGTPVIAIESGALCLPGDATGDDSHPSCAQMHMNDQANIQVQYVDHKFAATVINLHPDEYPIGEAWTPTAAIPFKHFRASLDKGRNVTAGYFIAHEIAKEVMGVEQPDAVLIKELSSNWHSTYGYLPRTFQLLVGIEDALNAFEFRAQ